MPEYTIKESDNGDSFDVYYYGAWLDSFDSREEAKEYIKFEKENDE